MFRTVRGVLCCFSLASSALGSPNRFELSIQWRVAHFLVKTLCAAVLPCFFTVCVRSFKYAEMFLGFYGHFVCHYAVEDFAALGYRGAHAFRPVTCNGHAHRSGEQVCAVLEQPR